VAAAGLNRLGLESHIRGYIDPRLAPPAPGQGALAIETRAEDCEAPWLVDLRCRETTLAVAAERGALAALDGSCRTAIGAYATLDGARLSLSVEALSPDGRLSFADKATLEAADEAAARELGLELGGEIKTRAGDSLGTSA